MKLPREVTIRDACSLASSIQHELESGVSLQIDASAVERIDASILQLLCALQRSAPETSIVSPSTHFRSAVTRCGLDTSMPLQETA